MARRLSRSAPSDPRLTTKAPVVRDGGLRRPGRGWAQNVVMPFLFVQARMTTGLVSGAAKG